MRHIAGVGIILLTVTLMFPVGAFAQQQPGRGPAPQLGQVILGCSSIDEFVNHTQSRFAEGRQRFESGYNQRLADLESRRQQQRDRLEEHRAENDNQLEARLEQLRERAETTEQIAAVETFVTTIRQLVTDHRTQVDAINQEFLDALDALLGEEIGAIDSLATERRQSVDALLERLRSMCSAGETDAAVRETFRNEMNVLHEQFRAERPQKEALAARIEMLRQERLGAMTAARNEFQEALGTARDNLEAAFTENR